MLAKLRTFSLVGIEAVPVEVEVDVSDGALPKTVLVGLPEAAVKESTHRVERALVNSGFLRPQNRIVINLAPAELPKQAASFDLPITLGILAGSGQLDAGVNDRFQGGSGGSRFRLGPEHQCAHSSAIDFSLRIEHAVSKGAANRLFDRLLFQHLMTGEVSLHDHDSMIFFQSPRERALSRADTAHQTDNRNSVTSGCHADSRYLFELQGAVENRF